MRQALRDDANGEPCAEGMKFKKRPKAKAQGKCKKTCHKDSEEVGEESDQDTKAAELEAEDKAIRNEGELPEEMPGRGRGRKGAGRGRGRGRSGRKRALPTHNDSWLDICNMCHECSSSLSRTWLVMLLLSPDLRA